MAKNLSQYPEFDGKVHKLSGMRTTVESTLLSKSLPRSDCLKKIVGTLLPLTKRLKNAEFGLRICGAGNSQIQRD